MKQIKKLLALVLALAICAAFALPALADDTENGITKLAGPFTLTMDSPQEGHTYEIYQIFTGDIATEGGKTILSNIKYSDSGYGKQGDTPPNATLDKLAKLTSDSAALNEFLNTEIVPSAKNKFTGAQALENGTGWSNLPGGYYLVKDVTEALAGKDDIRSAIMVEMVKDTKVTPKFEKPTPEKEEGNPDNAKSPDGYGIGDDVPFTLKGHVPVSQLVQYSTLENDKDAEGNPIEMTNQFYSLTFSDKMTSGLSFNQNSVKVVIKNQKEGGKDIEIPAEGMEITTDTISDDTDFKSSFSIKILDLFKYLGTSSSGWADYTTSVNDVIIEVYYTSKITSNVDFEKNEKNEVTLKFRNDPTQDSEGKVEGESKPQDVPVYTFPLDVLKTDGGDPNKPLAGAKFQVKKGDDVLKFVKVETSVTEGEGESATTTKTTTYKYYDPTKPDAYKDLELVDNDPRIVDEVETLTDGKILFAGLKAGDYTLVETEAPNGFNKCNDIVVTIVPGKDDEGNLNGDYTYTIKQKDANGQEQKTTDVEVINVANNKGSTLPSTGGIGTTIFYVVGAVLVVGAGVLLFTKRRIKN